MKSARIDRNLTLLTLLAAITGPSTIASAESSCQLEDAVLTTVESTAIVFDVSSLDSSQLAGIWSVDGAMHGTLTETSENLYRYTPDPGFAGDDVLRYSVTCTDDGVGMTGEAELRIGVLARRTPLVGAWFGDGIPLIGSYNAEEGVFFLCQHSQGTHGCWQFPSPLANRVLWPASGDFNDDGHAELVLLDRERGRFHRLDVQISSLTLSVEEVLAWGRPGTLPVIGDWDGDGSDQYGLFQPWNGRFKLRSTGGGATTIHFTTASEDRQPLAGDWDSNGTVTLGLHHASSSTYLLANALGAGTTVVGYTDGEPGAIGFSFNRAPWSLRGFYAPSSETFSITLFEDDKQIYAKIDEDGDPGSSPNGPLGD